ncbi:MAG: HD domain-containing protein [Clostridia bacterium]|nr:HD domain-containing protein [Clostridia bacterium]
MTIEISAVSLINIILLAAGIGVCILGFLHIKMASEVQSDFRYAFVAVFILLTVFMASHIARSILDGTPGAAAGAILRILAFTGIFAAGMVAFVIFLLFIFLEKRKNVRKTLIIMLCLLFSVNLALLIFGSVSGAYYSFGAENTFTRGPLYPVIFAVPLILTAVNMVILARYGKHITPRLVRAFWFFFIAAAAAMPIQCLTNGIQYTVVAAVLGSATMYFVLLKEQRDVFKHNIRSIERLQDGLILVMADLVESRDKCTGDHVRKTAEYTRIIMEQMRKDCSYPDELTDEFIEDVVRSAPLHDVGKIQVSDAILNKPGRLTPEEFEEIKSHTTAGRDILTEAIDMVSEERSGYLLEARNLAYCHHEKWNGTGYPQGLAGEKIPLSARIMAVADVFDALVSKRSYKEGLPIEKATEIIREGIGTHFDPLVAEAFLKAGAEVRAVALSHEKKAAG